MHDLFAAPSRASESRGRTCEGLRLLQLVALVAAIGACALTAAAVHSSSDLVPVLWPAGGLLIGLMLLSPPRWRPWALLASTGLIVLAWLETGQPWERALGFAAAYMLAAETTRALLLRGDREATLRDEGDVSRLIGAVAGGSLVAGTGAALTVGLTGSPAPWQAGVSGFGGTAAAALVLLPLFVRPERFEAPASETERVVQATITLGTTALVFSDAVAPPLVFAVLPMFAWHAFRGTPREATWVLVAMAVIATTLTELGIGPIAGLGPRYDLSSDLVNGVLQLFIIDGALILLPISVVTAQQRRSAAQATAERRTLERVVSSASGTAIVATDRAGLVTVFNPAAEQMWSCCATEVMGQAPDVLWSEEELRRLATWCGTEPVMEQIFRAMVAHEEPERLWRSGRRDGVQHLVRTTVSPLTDEVGEHAGYLLTAEDVTEREQAQQVLLDTLAGQQDAVDRLRDLERVKTDFVATVSHELRSPITSIIGYTELLEDDMVGALTDGQRDVVGRVDRNGRRLLALVEDLLTLSQIENARLRIEARPIDLSSVMLRARDALADTLCGRRLELDTDLPELPMPLEADPVQLERMLSNLLTNAAKFTPDGGRIELSARTVGDGFEIVVRDTGMGIPATEQDQLFSRFFRASTVTHRAIAGTGLGLTIVHAIVALHGGRVGVISAEGSGTEVTVWLPPAPPRAGTPASIEASDPAAVAS